MYCRGRSRAQVGYVKFEKPSKHVSPTIQCGFGYMSWEFMGKEI